MATHRLSPNEGWFADTAFHLASTGRLGTTILEGKGTWLEGIGRRTYWILPLHPLCLALVFRIFGFGVWTMRGLSVAWGVVALVACFRIMRALAGTRMALAAVLLAATDYHVVVVGSFGRMDMMCAALGSCGLAAYLGLRERSLPAAMLASNGLVAAACLTHPCGVLYVAGLIVTALQLDRRRLTWRIVTLAALPYLAGAAGYGVYILQDPRLFARQFFGNVSGLAGEASNLTRFSGLRDPLGALRREVVERYGNAFNAIGAWTPARLQGLVLIAYFGSVLVALMDAGLRRQRAVRVLLGLIGTTWVMLWLLDGLKLKVYVVHIVPAFAGLTTLWIWNWTEGLPRRRFAAVAAMVAIQVAGVAQAAREYSYRNEYLATVQYLKQRAGPDSLIMASAEFGFAFGFDRNVTDDMRLGYYTGKRPEFYVDSQWYEEWMRGAETREPAVYQHVRRTLAEHYREELRNYDYTIYRRR